MSTPQPNPYSQPTQWNFNPLADNSNVINYDGDNVYDDSAQPYDGYSTATSTVNWRNATSWTNSLVVGSYQEYYGGPSYVPLYGAPTQWFTNETPDNEAGVYDPSNSAYANLHNYDQAVPYDGTLTGSDITYSSSTPYSSMEDSYNGTSIAPNATDYDGTNGASFTNWRNPTAWTVITGNRSQ